MSDAATPLVLPAESGSPQRAVAFLAIFALALIGLKPFTNLGAEDALDLVSGRDVLTYVSFAGLAAISAVLVWRSDAPALARLRNPAFIALAGWVAVCALRSPEAAVSIKRAALFALVAGVAAAAPLLPRGRAHLADLLAVVAAVVVGASYFGVAFLPAYAIHQAADIVEPELAGAWRGIFEHKNDASLVFGMLGFVGVYVARAGRPAAGAAIGALSLAFLVFTKGKSATMLWAPVLLLSFVVANPRVGRLGALAALTPLVLLNALGVGSTVFAPLQDLVAKLPIDPTFTGRVDIWRLAMLKIEAKPFAGYGYGTFWTNPGLRFDADNGWLAGAAHAHNGYVDAALSMGLIGVVLTIWAFVALPLSDVRSAVRRGADPALTAMFVQIWLYGLYTSAFETFLFDRANPVWFTFLFAVFGLRYVAAFRTSPA